MYEEFQYFQITLTNIFIAYQPKPIQKKKSFNRFKNEILKIQKHTNQIGSSDIDFGNKNNANNSLNYDEINVSKTVRRKPSISGFIPKTTSKASNSAFNESGKKRKTLDQVDSGLINRKQTDDNETMNNIITNYLALDSKTEMGNNQVYHKSRHITRNKLLKPNFPNNKSVEERQNRCAKNNIEMQSK